MFARRFDVIPAVRHNPVYFQRLQTRIHRPSCVNGSRSTQLTDLEAFSIAKALTEDTGLPVVVYLHQKISLHKKPRISVSRSYGDKVTLGNWFAVTIEENPELLGEVGKITARDINLVTDFVALNQELLLNYWEQVPPLSTKNMLNSLCPLAK